MDYSRQVQKAIDFMEARLTTKIELEDVADIACFSMYHFHRMFSAIVGYTMKDYIRRRRLSKAAREVVFSLRTIEEIAGRYQFESQASFTRAFKKQFAITPGKLRKTRQAFKHFNPIDVKKQFKRKGEVMLEPKLVEKEEFKVVGMKVMTTIKENKIPMLWNDFMKRSQEIKNQSCEKAAVGVCPSPISAII